MSQSHQSKVSTSRRRLIKAALAGIVAPAVLRGDERADEIRHAIVDDLRRAARCTAT